MNTSPRVPAAKPAVALAIMLGAQLMIILDATVVNIALPHIQAGLGFSSTSLSWVLNGYTLTFGGLLLLGGRVGDILGRRRTFLAGIIIFTLASLAGGGAGTAGSTALDHRDRNQERGRRHGEDDHQLRAEHDGERDARPGALAPGGQSHGTMVKYTEVHSGYYTE